MTLLCVAVIGDRGAYSGLGMFCLSPYLLNAQTADWELC